MRMTIHVADIASYQGALSLGQLAGAGFSGINLKVSHGLTLRSVHPDAIRYAADAAAAEWKISTFHWLVGSASGADQARFALGQMQRYGLARPGVAHAVDVESTEDPPTQQVWRDYCTTMAQLLGHGVITYTGDWWWYGRAAGWASCSASPWLWAAPRAGYLPAYPGDDSEHWRAGYGQWPQLAVMQYAVGAIAGVPVSQSAVRSEDAWRAMGGLEMVNWTMTAGMQNLVRQIDARWPNRDRASDGGIGDAAHAAGTSGHNPDDSPYDNAEWDSDPDSISEVRARDVDTDFGEPGTTAQMVVDHVRSLPGTASVLRYIIYNRTIYRASNGFEPQAYSGPSPHTEHIHFSGAWSQASDNNATFDYRLEQVGDMTTDASVRNIVKDLLLNDKDVQAAFRAYPWQYAGRGLHDAGSSLEALADSQDIVGALGVLAAQVAEIRAAMIPPASPVTK